MTPAKKNLHVQLVTRPELYAAKRLAADAFARRVRKVACAVEDESPEENIRMILAIVQQQQAEIAELSRRLAKHTEVSEQNAHARRQSV